MSDTTVKSIARTALGVALVIMAQFIGKMLPAGAVIFGPFSVTQLVTGSLVNCVLFVFASQVGMLSGIIIGILSAILASVIGVGPAIIAIMPLIALSNAIIPLVYCLLQKINRIFATVVAALIKCGFLWLSVPMLLEAVKAPEKQLKALSIMFSWPQGITALVGGALAYVIIHRLKAAAQNTEETAEYNA